MFSYFMCVVSVLAIIMGVKVVIQGGVHDGMFIVLGGMIVGIGVAMGLRAIQDIRNGEE